MAGRLTPVASILLMLGAWGVPAFAQSGGDPTRPAIDEKPVATESETSATPASTGLQTIIRRKNAKPGAIINGEYVELGGRVGEARLSEVGDGYVVMTSPGGAREVLMQTPGVEKKMLRKNAEEKVVKKPRRKMPAPARKEQ